MNNTTLKHNSLIDVYPEHNKRFGLICRSLENYFYGYTNKNKIIVLLNSWLFVCNCIIKVYGIQSLKQYGLSNTKDPLRFAYFYEFRVGANNRPYREKNAYFFKLFSTLFTHLYLPGASIKSIRKKILSRVTRLLADSIPTITSPDRKEAMIQILISYFGSSDHNFMEKYLNSFLPIVFYADQLRFYGEKNLTLEGAAHAIMDFNGYENLLLSKRKIRLEGRQHGGGYDMFKDDYYADFEKNLCDEFLGWGFAERNEKQKKYPSIEKKSQNISEKIRVIWVESPVHASLRYCLNRGHYLQNTNKDVFNYTHNELILVNSKYYSIPYPNALKSSDYKPFRGEILDNNMRAENIITFGDIVIFNDSGGSLIHHCIENEIIFLLVVSRESSDYFTEKKSQWFQLLREANLAFFEDEEGKLAQKLSKILTDKLILPSKVSDFHEKHFKNISDTVE